MARPLGLGETVTFYIKRHDGAVTPCGQLYNGRLVYWSLQNTFMRKYCSPRGMHKVLLDALEERGITEIDLVMPAQALRATVADVRRGSHAIERGEEQYFLEQPAWRLIERYEKPHYQEVLDKVVLQA